MATIMAICECCGAMDHSGGKEDRPTLYCLASEMAKVIQSTVACEKRFGYVTNGQMSELVGMSFLISKAAK